MYSWLIDLIFFLKSNCAFSFLADQNLIVYVLLFMFYLYNAIIGRYQLLFQHERPIDEKLTKKQQNQMQILVEKLDELAEMISNRVVENLRRKNEAMKQSSKRERSDPSAHFVPSVSPCCLSDDSISLRLLVKLGKSQEAATAYSGRRSLLLLERYDG
jgi:hypothetical protein